MNTSLLSSLEGAIGDWIANECETDNWTIFNVIIGNDTERLMALAAWCVLEAMQESQEYGQREGYFE